MKRILHMMLVISMILVLSGCDLFESNDGPFTITFDSNGGTDVDDLVVDAFDPFLPPSIPSKTGYIFGGWYIDDTLYYPATFQTGTNKNLTLYAKWIQIGELLDEDLIIEAILDVIDVVALFEEEMIDMIDRVQPSVVLIEAYDGALVETTGSGVIYHHIGNTYYLLTNEHVIHGYAASDLALSIFLHDEQVTIPQGQVSIVDTSILHDLAVLSFTSSTELPTVVLAQPDDIKVGQLVFSMGHPLDLPQTIDLGLISSINLPMSDGMGMDTIMIQHSASINPGSSGGALVNIKGELVGINTMSYVDEVVGEGIESLHFAVSIDIILTFIADLH